MFFMKAFKIRTETIEKELVTGQNQYGKYLRRFNCHVSAAYESLLCKGSSYIFSIIKTYVRKNSIGSDLAVEGRVQTGKSDLLL